MILFNFLKIAFLVYLFSSCQNSTSSTHSIIQDSVERVDLTNREEIMLPVELDEISGHTFVKGHDDLVYCIQDEEGAIFVFDLKSKQLSHSIAFAKKGDYEGITNDGSFFYVLKSNGSIYSLPISDDFYNIESKEFKGLLEVGEYESIGIDTIEKKIVVLCKDCKLDRKENQTTGYLLDYDNAGDLTLNKSFIIDLKLAQEIYSKFPKVFNPSAITRNTNTNEWYILSSVDKLILITDSNFKPKAVIPFSRKSYEQPEGIAYDSNGSLYISSEKGDEASGMIYKIKK